MQKKFISQHCFLEIGDTLRYSYGVGYAWRKNMLIGICDDEKEVRMLLGKKVKSVCPEAERSEERRVGKECRG